MIAAVAGRRYSAVGALAGGYDAGMGMRNRVGVFNEEKSNSSLWVQ